jgi:Kef-type K+ transport systems, membrane components
MKYGDTTEHRGENNKFHFGHGDYGNPIAVQSPVNLRALSHDKQVVVKRNRILFLSVAIVFGHRYATLFSKLVNRLNTRGALVTTALTFALLLGYVAEEVRVAPLVGACAAGLFWRGQSISVLLRSG